MRQFGIVICILCVSFSMGRETYRAGVLRLQHKEITEYSPFIYEAGKTGVDILVLPPLESSGSADTYDEIVNVLSKASKEAGLYVVAYLYEKARCQLTYETVRSNLVLDRRGSIVAVKPINGVANCTTSPSELVTFTTDFGVTFGILMEEDIVLYDLQHMKEVKNFVMTGDLHSELPFLDADQFAPSWTYVTNANLISTTGIYGGKAGLKTEAHKLAIADLHKNCENGKPAVPNVNPSTLNFLAEDLSEYVIRPLDLEAGSSGFKESICQNSFCCEFYVKTGVSGPKSEASYSLAAYNGVRSFSATHNVGAQICTIFRQTGSESSLKFERILIAANFTKQNAQYPIVQSAAVVPTEHFKFETKSDGISQQVTLEVVDAENVVIFGIFGKDFSNNLESNVKYGEKNNTETTHNDIYDYIFNEDVQEIVDYVWIRLRVLIVVVSIYILEMM